MKLRPLLIPAISWAHGLAAALCFRAEEPALGLFLGAASFMLLMSIPAATLASLTASSTQDTDLASLRREVDKLQVQLLKKDERRAEKPS